MNRKIHFATTQSVFFCNLFYKFTIILYIDITKTLEYFYCFNIISFLYIAYIQTINKITSPNTISGL